MSHPTPQEVEERVSSFLKKFMRKMDLADGHNDGTLDRDLSIRLINQEIPKERKAGHAFEVVGLERLREQLTLMPPKTWRYSDELIDELVKGHGLPTEANNPIHQQQRARDAKTIG